jgi:hypothetical protein
MSVGVEVPNVHVIATSLKALKKKKKHSMSFQGQLGNRVSMG